MKCVASEPVGATVTDLSLPHLDDTTVAELQRLLAEHGVLVLPGQDQVDDATFVAFLRRLGEPTFTPGETPVEGFPDLNVISNVGRTTPPRSTFHTDSSYLDPPPSYTALRAVTIPARGGETLFTNQYLAYETLPEELREVLDGRTITHVVTGVETDDDRTSADHPIFRRHPVSGRTALYLSTPQRCAAISGMADAEAQRVVATLVEHSTQASNTLRHAWAPGDVVVWDNACVLHRADHADVVGDRIMHRGMVTGYPSGPAVEPSVVDMRVPRVRPTLVEPRVVHDEGVENPMSAILFGSISTLSDTSELQRRSFNEAFADHGIDWRWDRDDYRAMLTGNGGAQRITDEAARTGTQVDADAVHATKSQNFQATATRDGLAPRDGVAETIRAAKDNGLKVALVTTTSPENIAALLTGLGSAVQASDFDVVVDSSKVGTSKPDPASFRYALEQLGERAEDCVAIEDNVGGVEAAVAAGVTCVAFPNENTAGQDFAHASQVVDRLDPDRLRELTRASS